MAVRLFIGNLPYDVTEAELRAHFAAVGPLASLAGDFCPTPLMRRTA